MAEIIEGGGSCLSRTFSRSERREGEDGDEIKATSRPPAARSAARLTAGHSALVTRHRPTSPLASPPTPSPRSLREAVVPAAANQPVVNLVRPSTTPSSDPRRRSFPLLGLHVLPSASARSDGRDPRRP